MYLWGDVELVHEADLFAENFSGVGGEMELHLLQQSGGF